jgi:hypothetical protein
MLREQSLGLGTAQQGPPLAAAEILSKDSRIRIIICHSLNSHEADAEYEKLWT